MDIEQAERTFRNEVAPLLMKLRRLPEFRLLCAWHPSLELELSLATIRVRRTCPNYEKILQQLPLENTWGLACNYDL